MGSRAYRLTESGQWVFDTLEYHEVTQRWMTGDQQDIYRALDIINNHDDVESIGVEVLQKLERWGFIRGLPLGPEERMSKSMIGAPIPEDLQVHGHEEGSVEGQTMTPVLRLGKSMRAIPIEKPDDEA